MTIQITITFEYSALPPVSVAQLANDLHRRMEYPAELWDRMEEWIEEYRPDRVVWTVDEHRPLKGRLP